MTGPNEPFMSETETLDLISALHKAERLPRDTKELFSLLNKINNPLISSAVLSMLVRSELGLGGMPFEELFRLIGSPPMEYSYKQHDHRQVMQAWSTITGCVELILDGYRSCPSFRHMMDADPSLQNHFWQSVSGHEEFIDLLQQVFSSGVGQSLTVLHLLSLDVFHDLRHDGVNYNALAVLKKRVDLVLSWLGKQWTPEQIAAFPALIEFTAEVEALGNIDIVGEGVIYNEADTSPILAANPAFGLACLCSAYHHAPVDDGVALDTFPDRVHEVAERLPGSIDQQLTALITHHADPSVRRGAWALLERAHDFPAEERERLRRLAERSA